MQGMIHISQTMDDYVSFSKTNTLIGKKNKHSLKKGDANILYRWDVRTDKIKKVGVMDRIAKTLELYAGLSEKEIVDDIDEKARIIKWMAKNNYTKVDEVGHIVARYYISPDDVLSAMRKKKRWDFGTV